MKTYDVKNQELKANKLLNEIEQRLTQMPQGRLRIVNKGKYTSYYYCEGKDTNGNYLTKENEDLIEMLANKKYLMKAQEVVRKNLEAYREYGRFVSEKTLAQVYDELPEAIKPMVFPYEMSNEEYARRWIVAPYTKAELRFEQKPLKTRNNEEVRSKSELIIADKLSMAGVPYKYEKLYKIERYGTFYPDFTVLNKRTRQVYIWEHFGLMDNLEYRKKAFDKIKMYTEYQKNNGIKFLASFEDSQNPFDPSYIDNIIEMNFL